MAFETLLSQILLAFCLIIASIIFYFKNKYNHWTQRGVPSITPRIPWGNFRSLFFGNKCMSDITYDLYRQLKDKNHKHGGMFFLNTPVYMPIDPQYIKNILVSDFEYFNERGVHYNEKMDPLSSHLFNLPNKQWKIMRGKMTPTFTTGKLKMMFPTMVKCSEGLVSAVGSQEILDINDISIRYTLDIIGSCAFGIDCNSLTGGETVFKDIALAVTNPPYWNAMKFFISLLSPKLAKFANISLIRKEVIDFFKNLVKQTVEYREKNYVKRNDFMHLMIKMKNEDSKIENCDMAMDINQIAAQTYVFFAAGYETSSMTITLCLFELSQNMDIQEKVRDEIRKIIQDNNDKLTYEGLMSMTYLDNIVQETMRKYPSLGYLNRSCSKQYNVPGTDVVLEKGTMVLISVLGLHRDPDHYENPECFNPERFSEENKSKIKQYTYIPFGEGHRICIGARFGMVQTKICLAVLLANFNYTLNSKTKVPLEYNSTSFVNSLKSGIFLNVDKIDK